jgi:hypothetical protein
MADKAPEKAARGSGFAWCTNALACQTQRQTKTLISRSLMRKYPRKTGV